jgi:FixJ family two-component response regulator
MALRYYKEDRPDVVLLDLRMPGMDGIETMCELNKLVDPAPVIIMTAYGDIASAVEAMKCGAYDFIVKPPKPDQLMETLRRAAETSAQKGPGPDQGARADSAILESYNSLTEREREVFQLTARGLSSSQISEHLSISPRTVEFHRLNTMQKMNVSNKAGLIRCAVRLGILR